MLIELEELKNAPEKLLNLDFNEYIAEIGNSEDVTGNVTVKLTPYGVKVSGKLNTQVELTCDRCLQKFVKPVKAELDEDFLFGTLLPEGTKEYELNTNEFVDDLNGQDAIDVTELVYQTIILEIPTQVLCSESCEGTEDFEIKKEDEIVDPRLEQFKKLSESQKQEN